MKKRRLYALKTGLPLCLALTGSASAGYLDGDANDTLDPQFNASNYATQLISATGMIGQTTSDRLYNNPAAVLGAPNLYYQNAIPPGNEIVSIINAPFNTSPDGNPVITELKNAPSTGTIEVKMGSPVYADPTHPYGVDFIVYGNSFFMGSGGTVNNSTNLNTDTISGLFGHITSVSVSPDGVNWYTYPDTQSLLPYDAYQWNSGIASWSSRTADQLKPVNPGIYSLLPGVTANSPASSTAATAATLYTGAAGGTGYSLQGTGFSSIQYIKVTPGNQGTAPNSTYTVINAFAAARSMVIGDNLSIAPANIASGTGTLYFQNPSNLTQTMLSANFTAVSDVCTLSTAIFNNTGQLASIRGPVLGAYQLTVATTLQAGNPTYTADIQLLATGYLGNIYNGNGSDLSVQSWSGSAWSPVAFTYDASTQMVDIAGWSQLSSSLVVSENVLPGDADFDGRITIDDYLAIDTGYLNGLSGWAHGDFTNAGHVSAADYAIIDSAYAAQNGDNAQAHAEMMTHEEWFGTAYTNVPDALGGSTTVVVPEPGTLLVLTLGGAVLLRCRRGVRRDGYKGRVLK